MDLLRKKLASSNVSNTEGQVPSTVEEADYWISEGPSDRAPSDTSVFVEGELPRKYSDPNLNSPFLTFSQFENGLTIFYKKSYRFSIMIKEFLCLIARVSILSIFVILDVV